MVGRPRKIMANNEVEMIEVELLVDVWDENGNRLETNIKEYDEDGRLKVDPKSRTPITTTRTYKINADLAEKLINEGKARIPFRRKA